MKIEDVENIEIDGVDTRDYPDFCDAFISSANLISTGRELTEEELEFLTDTYPSLVNELAYESLI
jgi:hypothetical protein